jgi:hypothetical protein
MRRSDERFQWGDRGGVSGGRWKHPGAERRGRDGDKDERRPGSGSPLGERLLAETELGEELGVFVDVVALHVVEKLAAAAGHLEKAAAAVEILTMGAEVLGEVVDARGEERDLNLGRSGILIVVFELGDVIRANGSGHVLLVYKCVT